MGKPTRLESGRSGHKPDLWVRLPLLRPRWGGRVRFIALVPKTSVSGGPGTGGSNPPPSSNKTNFQTPWV